MLLVAARRELVNRQQSSRSVAGQLAGSVPAQAALAPVCGDPLCEGGATGQ